MSSPPPMPSDPIDVDALIKELEIAFASVNRDNAVSLHQTTVIDDMGTEEEMQTAFLLDHDQHWTEIQDDNLDEHNAALSFFDVKGWAYHLPAFLRWELKQWDGKYSTTSHDSAIYTLKPPSESSPAELYLYAWKLSRFDALNIEQRAACARFLRYLGWQRDDQDCREYYLSYWHQFDNQHLK